MKAHVQTIIVALLALALLALFFRGASLARVWAEMRDGRPVLLLLALGTTMTTYVLRALRWQYMLQSLGPVRFGPAFRATVIGFAANFLLPARAGEVLRPYLVAREERLSGPAAFATVVLERLLDSVAVLVLFGVFLLAFDAPLNRVSQGLFASVRTGGIIAGMTALGLLVVLFVLAGHPDTVARLALGIDRVLPRRVAQAASAIMRKFIAGLATVRDPRRLAVTFMLSFPLWLSIAAGIFLVTRAFHIQMAFTGAFLVMTMLVVGVAVPTPGAVGGFHYFYQLAVTSFYAVATDRADAAAIVLHAISFIPVTLLGLAFMARAGLSLGGMRVLASAGGQKQEEST